MSLLQTPCNNAGTLSVPRRPVLPMAPPVLWRLTLLAMTWMVPLAPSMSPVALMEARPPWAVTPLMAQTLPTATLPVTLRSKLPVVWPDTVTLLVLSWYRRRSITVLVRNPAPTIWHRYSPTSIRLTTASTS